METRAHHVLIGALTLLILAAAIGFTLWLSKSSHDKEYDLYDIVFEEAVSGLNKGGIVEFNGIRIGEVISLRFDQADAKKSSLACVLITQRLFVVIPKPNSCLRALQGYQSFV